MPFESRRAPYQPLRIGALWRERLTPVTEAVLKAFKARAGQLVGK